MRSVDSERTMKLLLVLASLSFTICKADDFIIRSEGRIIKVAKCKIDGDSIKIQMCYSATECPGAYPLEEYDCLKSLACGDSYLHHENKALKYKEGIFLVDVMKADGSNKVAVGASTINTSVEDLKKRYKEQMSDKTIYLKIEPVADGTYQLVPMDRVKPALLDDKLRNDVAYAIEPCPISRKLKSPDSKK